MAGFHILGDPYYPNHGNVGWLGEEPEDDHPIPLDDHEAEGFPDDSDSEPEVNNLPPAAQDPNPNPRPTFQGPTPLWATNLNRWSQEQGQPMPYNGDRSFYNLTEGGSADRVLPIMVRRISRNTEQGRATIDRVVEIDANSGVNTVRIRQLESAHERTQVRNAALQRELAETQAEVRELQAQQARSDRRMRDIERLLSESRTNSSSSRRR
ncbi:unnamed protein product [Lactuca virosa]|uniref:Uncharacterized protein n=1 Tax=Lactuca virosa TaxID=75947 RepID=A0AAU9ML26_9ASTR|nr:unnamed protein product [Lactuca virosa]